MFLLYKGETRWKSNEKVEDLASRSYRYLRLEHVVLRVDVTLSCHFSVKVCLASVLTVYYQLHLIVQLQLESQVMSIVTGGEHKLVVCF